MPKKGRKPESALAQALLQEDEVREAIERGRKSETFDVDTRPSEPSVSAGSDSMEREEGRQNSWIDLFPKWLNTSVLKKDLTGTFNAQDKSKTGFGKSLLQGLVKAGTESLGLATAVQALEHMLDGDAMDNLHEALEDQKAGHTEKMQEFIRVHGEGNTGLREYLEQVSEQYISDSTLSDPIGLRHELMSDVDTYEKVRNRLYYKKNEIRSLLLLQEKQKRLTYALLKVINKLEEGGIFNFNEDRTNVIDAEVWASQQDDQLIEPFMKYKEGDRQATSQELVRTGNPASMGSPEAPGMSPEEGQQLLDAVQLEGQAGMPISGPRAAAARKEAKEAEEAEKEDWEVVADTHAGASHSAPGEGTPDDPEGDLVGGGYKKTKKKRTKKRKNKTKKKKTQKRTKKKRTKKKRIQT